MVVWGLDECDGVMVWGLDNCHGVMVWAWMTVMV